MVTLQYLLDTNTLSELNRPQPNAGIADAFRSNTGSLATATVVWHELLYGLHRMPASARRRGVEAFLMRSVRPHLPFLPYDEAAAEWHAAERARLTTIGRAPPYADGQIAAVAAVNNLTLVTDNLEDYAAFQGLRVETWRR